MAADAFRRVRQGERATIAADAWNAMLETAEAFRVGQGFAQNGIDVSQSGKIWIRNNTADTLAPFTVVGIGAAVTTPTDDAEEYVANMTFESTAPAAGERFAILQEGIEPDTIGEARAFGLTHANVNMTDAAHGYAAPVDDDYDKLTSQAEPGPAEIYYVESGTGEKLARVLLSTDAAVDAGITSINSQTGPAVTFTIGTTGSDFNVQQAANVITYHLPDAGASSRGAVTTASQTIAGIKTLTSNPVVDTSSPLVNLSESNTGIGAIGKIDTIQIGLLFGGVTHYSKAYILKCDYDSGGMAWIDHTEFVLQGSHPTGGNDPNPAYKIRVGFATYTGQWTTIAGVDVSGGLITGGSLAIATTNITNSAVTNAKLADMPAQSLKANLTGSSAAPTDASVGDFTAGTAESGNLIVGWSAAGALRKFANVRLKASTNDHWEILAAEAF